MPRSSKTAYRKSLIKAKQDREQTQFDWIVSRFSEAGYRLVFRWDSNSSIMPNDTIYKLTFFNFAVQAYADFDNIDNRHFNLVIYGRKENHRRFGEIKVLSYPINELSVEFLERMERIDAGKG